MKQNLLIAHGGGPTPVINASLQGVIEAFHAESKGRIFGARFGAEGILKNDLIELTNLPTGTVGQLGETPASAIGSCRLRLGDEHMPAIIACIRKNNIHCVLYNGGNDSMDTCHKLSLAVRAEGLDVTVIGVPKTIDNDLALTDHSPGYGSAARFTAISTAEMALDASALPIHVVVVEIMGRNAGWITASASLARRAVNCELMVCLPERSLCEERFLEEVERRYKKGNGLLVAVSEGVRNMDGSMLGDSGIVDGFGHTVPGGAAKQLAGLIMSKTGIKARDEKPGLLGRASVPYVSLVDRQEAYRAGYESAKAGLSGQSGCMLAFECTRDGGYRCNTVFVPLDRVANAEKKFPTEWIDDAGYAISDDFDAYAMPLIGPELPQYAILR